MARFHVRVPLKAKAVFKLDDLPTNENMDDVLMEKFQKGNFIQTCEVLSFSERQIMQVCVDCGSELTPEECETGMCAECYNKEQDRIADEKKHPDERKQK